MKSFKEFFEERHKFGMFGKVADYRETLTEGLITSYPFKNVMVMLTKKYGSIITHIQSDIFNEESKTAGISMFINNSNFTQDLLNQINKDLKIYAYFVAHTSEYGKKETGFFIEPKFSFVIDHKKLKNKRCFHITNKEFLPKIQKVGLIPKDSQTHFNFDGARIYLMFGDNDDFIKSFMPTLIKRKKWDVGKAILLEITNFSNLELYYDINFNNDKGDLSTFTFDNISKDNLKIIS